MKAILASLLVQFFSAITDGRITERHIRALLARPDAVFYGMGLEEKMLGLFPVAPSGAVPTNVRYICGTQYLCAVEDSCVTYAGSERETYDAKRYADGVQLVGTTELGLPIWKECAEMNTHEISVGKINPNAKSYWNIKHLTTFGEVPLFVAKRLFDEAHVIVLGEKVYVIPVSTEANLVVHALIAPTGTEAATLIFSEVSARTPVKEILRWSVGRGYREILHVATSGKGAGVVAMVGRDPIIVEDGKCTWKGVAVSLRGPIYPDRNGEEGFWAYPNGGSRLVHFRNNGSSVASYSHDLSDEEQELFGNDEDKGPCLVTRIAVDENIRAMAVDDPEEKKSVLWVNGNPLKSYDEFFDLRVENGVVRGKARRNRKLIELSYKPRE